MFDFVILGGGSAGCALAARLSESPDNSVLLVEAGKDVTAQTAHPDVLASYPAKAYFNRDFTWQSMTALLGDARSNDQESRVRARYEQARILGGGSSINGLNANRGSPEDYDGWEALGADGWNWKNVLPYFRKLERDLNFDGEYHGNDGPIAISRYPIADWSGFVKGVALLLQQRGFAIRPDQNGEWEDGVMPATVSVDEKDRRVTCAIAYLTPKVRARPNLKIMTGTEVQRILFEGTRAVGAEIRTGAGIDTVRGREIVVACGTINSPAVLMRSGVGPVDELSKHGIPIVASVPGIGQNLLEHPVVSISCYLNRKGRLWKLERHHTQAHVRFSSRVAGCPTGDMSLALIARSGWHEIGKRVGSLYFWVNKSYSRGSVTLQSADPNARPQIDFRMLSDPRDLERLRNAFRFAAELATSPGLDGVRSKVFPSNYSDRVRKVSSPGLSNAVKMAAFAHVLDFMPFLRGWLIDTVVTGGVTLDAIMRDDATLDAYLNKAVVGVWHPVGTCRMGSESDPMTVTNASGLVRQVTGLRICDASVMPSIPCANTNIPTIMLAERMADLIKAERAQRAGQPA